MFLHLLLKVNQDNLDHKALEDQRDLKEVEVRRGIFKNINEMTRLEGNILYYPHQLSYSNYYDILS